MAQLSNSEIKDNITAQIYENTSGDVTAMVLATILKDMCDSFASDNLVFDDEFAVNEGLVLYDSSNFRLFYDPVTTQLKMENYSGDRFAVTAEVYKGTQHHKFSALHTGVGIKYISYNGVSDGYYGFTGFESIRMSLTIKNADRLEMIDCLLQLAGTTIDCQIKQIRK